MEDQETAVPESFFAGLECDFQEAASSITQDVPSTPGPTDLFDESIVDWLTDAQPSAQPGPVTRSKSATRSLVKVLGESRFGNQVPSTEELTRASKGFVPKNTVENTQWALRNFESWRQWRCRQMPDDTVPVGLGMLVWITFIHMKGHLRISNVWFLV